MPHAIMSRYVIMLTNKILMISQKLQLQSWENTDRQRLREKQSAPAFVMHSSYSRQGSLSWVESTSFKYNKHFNAKILFYKIILRVNLFKYSPNASQGDLLLLLRLLLSEWTYLKPRTTLRARFENCDKHCTWLSWSAIHVTSLKAVLYSSLQKDRSCGTLIAETEVIYFILKQNEDSYCDIISNVFTRQHIVDKAINLVFLGSIAAEMFGWLIVDADVNIDAFIAIAQDWKKLVSK